VTRVRIALANDTCSREEATGTRWPKRAFSLAAAGWRLSTEAPAYLCGSRAYSGSIDDCAAAGASVPSGR
jgi:hypothetical protein